MKSPLKWTEDRPPASPGVQNPRLDDSGSPLSGLKERANSPFSGLKRVAARGFEPLATAWRQHALLRLALIFVFTAGLVFGLTPLYNIAAVGSPTANLYTLVWAYDQVGFGECCGRSGHTPEKALINMKRDLALWSSDLFGWQMDEATHQSLAETTGWWLGPGLSWALLPVGLVAGRRKRWAWLLLGTFAGLVGVHLLYWIGAQVYSARYYFEALPGLALVSAVGITALARRTSRPLIYVLFGLAVAANLLSYVPYRLTWTPTNDGPKALWRFNDVGRDDIAALETLRDGRPVLILVTGEERRTWRDWGTYMALTSPSLDSDVVAARVHSEAEQAAVLARFPGRQVLYLRAGNWLETGP